MSETGGQRTVRNSGRHSGPRLTATERQAEAIKLRKGGMSFDRIARELGYASRDGAWRAVDRGMSKAIQEPADELRALEQARLDDLQLSLWRDAMGGTTADPTSPEQKAAAVRTIIRVMERRARLLGLDEPAEYRLRLDTDQVAFMEAALRRVTEAIHGALVAAGLEQQVVQLWPAIEGEVVPRELAAVAAAAAATEQVAS